MTDALSEEYVGPGPVASYWLDCLHPGLSSMPTTRFLTKGPGPIGRVYTGQCWGHSRTLEEPHSSQCLSSHFQAGGWDSTYPCSPAPSPLESLFPSQTPHTAVLEITSHLSEEFTVISLNHSLNIVKSL